MSLICQLTSEDIKHHFIIVPRSRKAIVLWSLCSIHPVNTGSIQCPLLTLFQPVHTCSIQCPLVTLFHPPSTHRFYTVSFGFGHSVPSTEYTQAIYSVLCSLCSIHPVYTGSIQCPLLTLFQPVHTGSIQCPLVTLFHPASTHRLYTVSFGHCSIRPVHTGSIQYPLVTVRSAQYTQTLGSVP